MSGVGGLGSAPLADSSAPSASTSTSTTSLPHRPACQTRTRPRPCACSAPGSHSSHLQDGCGAQRWQRHHLRPSRRLAQQQSRQRRKAQPCRAGSAALDGSPSGLGEESSLGVPLARSVPYPPGQGPVGGGDALTLPQFLHALYKFSRPHTMCGTAISIVSVSLLALDGTRLSLAALSAFLRALVPALLMNVTIVGLNQVFDIEIDRINKPYLPLASGEFTPDTAMALVVGCGLGALALGALWGTAPLMATLVGSLLLGIAYSTDLPGLRWKQHPAAAAACILAVRAVMVQLGFWLHMRVALQAPLAALTPSGPLLFAISLMLCFSIVIALFKDIPDIRGDRQLGVRTLSVRVGPQGVFWACIGIMEAAYLGATVVGLLSGVWWSRVAIAGGHAVLGALLWRRAQRVDLGDSASIAACYQYLWRLFYAEYLLIPLLR